MNQAHGIGSILIQTLKVGKEQKLSALMEIVKRKILSEHENSSFLVLKSSFDIKKNKI